MVQSWFLIQLKPNSHRIAEKNLGRQGFETFLPLQETTRRQDTRFVSALRPLFPGYMFVRLDPHASPWRKINATYGVARIVSFTDGPAPVPDSLVLALLDRCDERGHLLKPAALASGDNVKVVEGPFAEFAGTVETIDAEKRVWLLLEFMGQTTRIQVAVSQVVAMAAR
jgi:transcriptional antiterminator RfaH